MARESQPALTGKATGHEVEHREHAETVFAPMPAKDPELLRAFDAIEHPQAPHGHHLGVGIERRENCQVTAVKGT